MGEMDPKFQELESILQDIKADRAEPCHLPFEFLEYITDNFSEGRVLGKGGFGVVYKGVLECGEIVAVKKLTANLEILDKQYDNESHLFSLKHENIVRILGFCSEAIEVVVKRKGADCRAYRLERLICLEYMPNGSLDGYITDASSGLNWNQRFEIIKGICCGLYFLHEENQMNTPVIHLDLTPANILLTNGMVPKITDFGLSRLFGGEKTRTFTMHFVGKLGYMAAELWQHGKITKKSDIFSLGVIILETITGKKDYPLNNETTLVQNYVETEVQKWRERMMKDLSCTIVEKNCLQIKNCIETGLKCVNIDDMKRPTAKEIIESLNRSFNSSNATSSRAIEGLGNGLNDGGIYFASDDEMCKAIDGGIYFASGDEMDSLMSRDSCGPDGPSPDSCGPLSDYCIPDYILNPDSEQIIVDNPPCCPVLVFVNSRSGGQLGSSLIKTYRELLNEAQVFDLSEEAPDKVLHRIYCNFEKLRSYGDILAFEIQKRLRLIVAGGDDTASWLLGVVSDLKLSQPPPIATMPLGTENNIPFSFGWCKKNPAIDQPAVKSFLGQVKRAREMNIDSWHIIMRMRIPQEGPCDPIAPLVLPYSLHAFHHAGSDSLNMEGYVTFRGGFWNYFSVGMDAQVSYESHSERKRYPEKLKNQGTYAKLGLKQGWFTPSLTHPSSSIAQLAKVTIMKRPGWKWEELQIPSSIRSIVCLNLPSFSGGSNPWGTPSTRKVVDRDLTPAYVDDGLIEVVGFRDAWHSLILLAPNGHGTRLAQVHRLRFEFHKGAAEHTFMRIDGEPWKQPLPKEDDTVVVEISHLRQVTMLASDPCKLKSINDPSSPCHPFHDDDDTNSLDDEDEWGNGRKKFGAAATFKFPEEVDIAHLS